MPQIIAFFDMDRTLLRESSGVLYLRYLRQHGRVGRRVMLRSYWYAALYKAGILDYPTVAGKLAMAAADANEAETNALFQRFFDEMLLHYVAAPAIQRLNEHRAQGHIATIISASTPNVVGPLAAHLSIDDYLCTRVEVIGGRLTGRILRPACYGSGKIYWAEDLLRRHGGDMATAFFYSDGISDLPLLLRVGHPVAVNPDRRLKAHALRSSWPIETFY